MIFQRQKNPYAKMLKQQVTIRLDGSTVEYFKGLSDNNGIPYETLINLYLSDCANRNKKISLNWQ
jgi:hypothetical protein